MFATATYFQHTRLFGIFAVFSAIFAIRLRRAIASGMRALIFLLLCHKNHPAFWYDGALRVILRLNILPVKEGTGLHFNVLHALRLFAERPLK